MVTRVKLKSDIEKFHEISTSLPDIQQKTEYSVGIELYLLDICVRTSHRKGQNPHILNKVVDERQPSESRDLCEQCFNETFPFNV